jgi:hypothetical protein
MFTSPCSLIEMTRASQLQCMGERWVRGTLTMGHNMLTLNPAWSAALVAEFFADALAVRQ